MDKGKGEGEVVQGEEIWFGTDEGDRCLHDLESVLRQHRHEYAGPLQGLQQ